MSQEQLKAAFIPFYSFKGGVGRSMALINTAGMLAGRGFKVLVIDLDLEAPGLSYLNPDGPMNDLAARKSEGCAPHIGFVDLLLDAKSREEKADLFLLSGSELVERYTRSYHLPQEICYSKDGSLRIMPAGKLDGDYTSRFDSLNLRQLYEQKVGEPLIRAFKKKFAEAELFDYILVDSRTGFSDEAGICTRDLADYLIIISGLNRQNVEGTCAFLEALRIATAGREPRFQIILSPVPTGEDALVDEREMVASRAFEKAWGSKVDLSLEIPYHPQLALTEAPHIFRRRRVYLFDAYSAIEDRVLKAIGHDAPTLTGDIEIGLKNREYLGALRALKMLIRVNGGKSATSQIAVRLATDERPSKKGKENTESSNDGANLEAMIGDVNGRVVAEFFVDEVSIGESAWEAKALLQKLIRIRTLDLADRLFKRLTAAATSDADILGSYAVFLETELEDKDGAAAYYRRAIDAAPANARNLGNYADFLDKQNGSEGEAKAYYLRAIEAEPKDSAKLGNYAAFLWKQCGDNDSAESYFLKAIEADPKNARNLGNYAVFLATQRGDDAGADSYHLKAIENAPQDSAILSNYGQFLVGLGRVADGLRALSSAFEHLDRSDVAEAAEICFCLALIMRMQGLDPDRWERGFKFFLQRGFERPQWNFDGMLRMAEKLLPREEFEYTRLLALAFIDEHRAVDVEKFERWNSLEPLDPLKREGPSRPRAEPENASRL